MQLQGLTELQERLLQTAQQTPGTMKKILNKTGTKATQKARKKSRQLVKKQTGNYHKKWKKGKVFQGREGELVVRVLNTSPHGHLIEDGHLQLVNPPKPSGRGVIPGKGIGRNVGFVPGKKVLKKSMDEFESSGEMAQVVGDMLDDLLMRNRL